jgi:hypothetical protein
MQSATQRTRQSAESRDDAAGRTESALRNFRDGNRVIPDQHTALPQARTDWMAEVKLS